jgi:coproporphyrinogen III oxidase-like Fe-S oxidoreductase
VGDSEPRHIWQVPLDALLPVWRKKLLNDFSEDKEFFNVYVDSPFCVGTKCLYCCHTSNIIRSASGSRLVNRYYNQILLDHIKEFKDVLSIRTPDTIYFGGGTSSLMSLAQMDTVFNKLQNTFDLRNSVKEKRFEFNPWHVTEEKLQLLGDWNFTHVTLGIQTFHETVLESNNRSSPSLDQLTVLMDLLEKFNIWYNVDLMTFIYRDDLEEDLRILKTDLEVAEKKLYPKRITVYPNYFKLKNPQDSVQSREYTFNKIRRLREVVSDFCARNTYVEANKTVFAVSDEDLYSNYRTQHSLIRRDLHEKLNWPRYSCSGWPNTNYHQNVLALGGYGKRRPYSYISNKLCYETCYVGNNKTYQLIYAEPELIYDMIMPSRT